MLGDSKSLRTLHSLGILRQCDAVPTRTAYTNADLFSNGAVKNRELVTNKWIFCPIQPGCRPDTVDYSAFIYHSSPWMFKLHILFFPDFSYSVYRHELNVYFSLEAALLAGQCFTILNYFGIIWGKNRGYGYLTPSPPLTIVCDWRRFCDCDCNIMILLSYNYNIINNIIILLTTHLFA